MLARDDIDKLIDACADMRDELDVDSWSSSVRGRHR
jgi:hypothetical protein